MYGIHKGLLDLFNGYQGQNPKKASVLIFGIDANYNENLSNESPFFEKILEYNRDGVDFWKKYGKHHPFLLDEYPKEFDKRKGGVPYHRNFAKLDLDTKYADYISFVELLGFPTIGSTKENILLKYLESNTEHLKWIDSILMDNTHQKLLLIPDKVLKPMKKMKKYKFSPWLNKNFKELSVSKSGIIEFQSDLQHKIYGIAHFSGYKIHKQIPEIKQLIEDFCENKDDEEKQ